MFPARPHLTLGQRRVGEPLQSHKPFHWFIEFYGIMKAGGFDVAIGNPPYLELNTLSLYHPLGYTCESAGNIYALMLERSLALRSVTARLGFIVPVSSISTDRYVALEQLLSKHRLCYSAFDDRPSRLFEGLEHVRLAIHLIGEPIRLLTMHSTRYHKWISTERSTLFHRLRYASATPMLVNGTMPKLSSEIEHGILRKLGEQAACLSSFYSRTSGRSIFYSRKVGYFLQVLDFEPRVLDGHGNRRPPSEFKELSFQTERQAQLALACLNSSLFYWFITVFSDCRHVNKREVDVFPIDLGTLESHAASANLLPLSKQLMKNLDSTSEDRVMRFRHDTLTVQCILPKQSKAIIDEIDTVLAKHYGFTDEELDFIINYDIKYRMGADALGEEEEE